MKFIMDMDVFCKDIEGMSDQTLGAYMKLLISHMKTSEDLPANIRKCRKKAKITSRNKKSKKESSSFSLDSLLVEKFNRSDQGYSPNLISKPVDNLWITCGQTVDNILITVKMWHNCIENVNHSFKYNNINYNNNNTDVFELQVPEPIKRSYIFSSLTNTIANNSLQVSSRCDLLDEVCFYVDNRGDKTFKHAVNICMKLISKQRWTTPWGYRKNQKLHVDP
jgi:hypothetical protein